MSAGSLHFHAHAGHEIRPASVPDRCACGGGPVDRAGRCEACQERQADRRLEDSRGELD